MLHLKNNAIALVTHAFLAALLFLAFSFIESLRGEAVRMIIFLICFLAYIACGFFLLRPVKEKSFLSVVSVLVAMIITVITVLILSIDAVHPYEYEHIVFYFYANPSALFFCALPDCLPTAVNGWIAGIGALLSPIIPSLLMYAGMVLRRRFQRRKCMKLENSGN